MKYKISLNDEDYLKFNIFSAYRTNGGKHAIRTIRLMTPLFSVIFLLLLLISGSESYMILTSIIFLTILSLMMYVRAPKILQKNTRKMLIRMKKDGKLPYHAFSEIEFLDSVIVERFEQGEFRLKYEEIEHIYFEDDYLYIFYSAMQAFVLPCRDLGAEKDRVTEFLMKKCLKHKKI